MGEIFVKKNKTKKNRKMAWFIINDLHLFDFT